MKNRLMEKGVGFDPSHSLFITKEQKHRLSPYSPEWWDRSAFSRGNTALHNGITPSLRVETDYSETPEGLRCSSDFYPSEFTSRTIRRRKTLKLSSDLNSLFFLYHSVWNRLVDLDQRKSLLGLPILQEDLELRRLSEINPLFVKKTLREYQQRRNLASSPLRRKRYGRVKSIPFIRETTPEAWKRVKERVDHRRFIYGRLVKQGKKFSIRFSFSEKIEKEVNLRTNTIKGCRDPRLVDVGISVSPKGAYLVVQNPYEERRFFFIPSSILVNTKQFLENFFNYIAGKVRSLSLSDSTDPRIRPIVKAIERRGRTLAAVGATEFSLIPSLVPLGGIKRPNWERKFLKPFASKIQIQGLTGESLLIEQTSEGMIDHRGRLVSGYVLANHALASGLAKKGMSHGATFLSGGISRTVHKVEPVKRDTIKDNSTKKAKVARGLVPTKVRRISRAEIPEVPKEPKAAVYVDDEPIPTFEEWLADRLARAEAARLYKLRCEEKRLQNQYL